MNGYVLAANAIIWVSLSAYALSLFLRGRAIGKRLQQLEKLRD